MLEFCLEVSIRFRVSCTETQVDPISVLQASQATLRQDHANHKLQGKGCLFAQANCVHCPIASFSYQYTGKSHLILECRGGLPFLFVLFAVISPPWSTNRCHIDRCYVTYLKKNLFQINPSCMDDVVFPKMPDKLNIKLWCLQ